MSPQVVRIVGKEASRDLQLSAARGALPLDANDLLTIFFFFCNGRDQELKTLAKASLLELPVSIMTPVVSDPQVSPELLHFIARERYFEQQLIVDVLQNPSTADETFILCAKRCSGPILAMISENSERILAAPELIDAILNNPQADRALKYRLGWIDPAEDVEEAEQKKSEAPLDALPEEEEGEVDSDVEEVNLTKYQQVLVLGVSDKIKMALTGDKEWRTLLLRDPNKLVSSAVLKNPRITEGEVLAVAKNKAASDDMIRIILLNREWLKSYEMKKALMRHPRTPLNSALRFMSILTEKDLKTIAKSKDISAVLVNNARRIIMMKEKKG